LAISACEDALDGQGAVGNAQGGAFGGGLPVFWAYSFSNGHEHCLESESGILNRMPWAFSGFAAELRTEHEN
jgi:hypothetical protein